MAFFNWSVTAASNGGSDPTINFNEGQAPSSVNDSARALMARAREWGNDISGQLSTGGSSTAYTVASNQVFDSLAHMAGQMVAFVPHTTNGATVTLNVDGLGAKPLRSAPSVELGAGVLVQGTPYMATYSGADAAFYLHGFYGNPFNIPVGGMMAYLGATAPNTNFVLPSGQAISRTTYAALFALVSTTFGVGDGTTTFNVPDLRGRTIFALDNLGGSAANVLQASTTVSTTSGSPTATVGSATNIAPGMVVVSTNIPAATTVLAISGTTVTLSANASATASGTAARFSALSDAQAIGGTGGTQNHTITAAESAVLTYATVQSGATSIMLSDGVSNSSPDTGSRPRPVSVGVSNPTTTANAGGLPHMNVPPALALPFILRVI